MKKLLLLLLFLPSLVYSQIKFENKEWSDCKVPIVKLQTKAGPRNFIIDTGASYSFIDSNFAEKYGKIDSSLIEEEFCSVNSKVSNSGSFYKILIDSIQFRLLSTDMSYINTHTHSFNVIGILGADFIITNKLIIDYSERTITIKTNNK